MNVHHFINQAVTVLIAIGDRNVLIMNIINCFFLYICQIINIKKYRDEKNVQQ